MSVRFGHVNLTADDWRALAAFYVEVFGCEPVGPERDLEGEELARAVGLRSVRITGRHLRLPGLGPDGPTLEIFQYDPIEDRPRSVPNRPGYGHLAFQVDDVDATLERIVAAGGGRLGRPATLEVPGAGVLRFVYCKDPEGNVLELQRWE